MKSYRSCLSVSLQVSKGLWFGTEQNNYTILQVFDKIHSEEPQKSRLEFGVCVCVGVCSHLSSVHFILLGYIQSFRTTEFVF